MYPEVTESTPGICWKIASVHQKQPAPRVIYSAPSGILGGVAGICDSAAFIRGAGASFFAHPAPSKTASASVTKIVFIYYHDVLKIGVFLTPSIVNSIRRWLTGAVGRFSLI